MKLRKKIALILFVICIAMQFYHPEKNIAHGDHTLNFITETNPPTMVKTILQESCYNCHSNNTVYPWYNNIAPVSYWLANHVEDGKKHLNFSDWNNYNAKDKDHKLDEVIEMVSEGKMPLREYIWTHNKARLTDSERKTVIDWAQKTRLLYQLNQKQE